MLLLILAASLAYCQSDRKEGVTLHPTEENIPVVTDPRFILHEQEVATPWLEFTDLQGYTIGVNEGARNDMIGMVTDLAVTPEALYYTDAEYFEVRVYDFSGNLKTIIGGTKGVGPGEFWFPARVAVTEDGERLIVGDGGNSVEVFRRQGSTYTLEHSFRAAGLFLSGDICVMHGHIYTTGYADELDGIIHKYTLDGKHVASFGTPYMATERIVREKMSSQASLGCNGTHRIIGHTNWSIPVFTGYSDTGEEIWRVKFADVVLAPVRERHRSGQGPTVGNLSASIGEASNIRITAGIPSSAAFTVTYRIRGENNSGRHHFFRVDAKTGQGEYLGWYPNWHEDVSQPSVFALDTERVYTVSNKPYPQIGIYRRPDSLLQRPTPGSHP